MRKKLTVSFMVLFVFFSYLGFLALEAPACTIAVVSGSATPDGRPILWKNRDKDGYQWVNNEVKYFTDLTKTSNSGYIGVVDADAVGHGSTENTHVWSGINDNGFSICNSYAYAGFGTENGPFMKQALAQCETVDEFQKFLINWNQGNLTANFGVIDAEGGAAIFEVYRYEGNPLVFNWERFDAKNEPHGYIVRANFTQWAGGSTGLNRKQRAEELIEEAYTANNLTHEYILRNVSRDMITVPEKPAFDEEYDTTNCINRYRTRCCTVVQGVDYPENPHYSIMWTILGESAFGVAAPLFSYAHSVPDEFVSPWNVMAPMNYIIQDRELRCYDDNAYDTYIWAWPLCNPWNGSPAIWKYVFAIEDYTFKKTRAQINLWKSMNRIPVPKDFMKYQDYTSYMVYKNYDLEEFKPWK